MAFYYDITSSNTERKVVAKIRLAIGDTVEGKGPRPDGTNFDDSEILSVYDDEGDHEGRTQARLMEILSMSWAAAPKTMFGSLIDPTRVSRDYATSAMTLRKQHGYGQGAPAAFSVPMANPEPS